MDKAQQSKQVIDSNSDPSKTLPAQTKVTFYTDPKGLYATANLKTKIILKDAQYNGEINSDQIKVQNLGYEKKITGNNFCSHFFTPSVELYYICEQCSFSLGGFSTMCYCRGCFDEQRHIGHNVSTQTPYTDRAYCDCGRLERFKKQSFCKNHSTFDVQMSCQIDPDQEKQYIQSFITLFEIGIQKQNTQLLIKIGLYLQKLNENSVYYNRMTFKLLTSQSTSNKEKYRSQKYFFILSVGGYDFEKLMIHLGGDLRTRMNMIKFLSTYYGENSDNKYLNYFSSSNFKQLINITAAQKLIDQGFSHDFMYQILKNQNCSKKYPQLMFRILFLKAKSAQKLNQLHIFQNLQMEQFTVQLAELILFKILQFYPSSQKIRKSIKCQPDQQNPWGQFQMAESKQQIGQNLPYDVLKANKLIIKTISIIIVSDLKISRDIRVYIIKKGADPQKIEQIIYWLIVSSKLNCYSQGQNGNPFALITILLLIRGSPSETQNIQKFWSFLLQKQTIKKEDEQNKQSQIGKYADIFHFVITVLFRTDIFCIMEKKKSQKMKKVQNKNSNSALQEQALQNWFRSFLYQRKTVSRSQIIQLKNSGVLNFEGAGKILNQICTYNEDEQIFNFSHSKAYKNIINQFPLIPSRLNYQALYNNTIHFGQQIKFERGSLASDLLDQVLICKTLIPIFDKQWQRTIKKEDYLLNETKDGYLYLFVLVVYDILTKGFNQAVRAKLVAISNNQSLLSLYSCKQQDTKLIKRLLSLQRQEQLQSPKVQLKNDKKMLAEQKKKRIAQKYKKTRELMLQKIKSQTEGQLINENEETCILCHQKEKINNFLVYLSSINKNNTISGAVHGKNNVSNTYFRTCFHAIHVNCFIDYRKNSDLSFLCPLCQTQSNCIVPTSYSPQNKKLNRICQNAMIAHMVAAYRIYDVQSDFILIFKHLVESKGLNSLLQYSRYEQKKKLWLKNNHYFFQLMEKLYDNSVEQDKKRYLKSIDDFVEQIQACPRPICRLIQLLFAEALKSVLSQAGDRQVTKKILLELRSQLKHDEYLIIEQQLYQLFFDQNFPDLPQPTQQQIKKQKTSLSFSLVRLPQKALECQKLFLDKKCEGCTIQIANYYCLMCGIRLCPSCRQEHAKVYHNQTIIYFSLNNFKVECIRKQFYTNDDIYENQFKLTYSQRLDYDDMEKPEYYTLNELKFQRIINKFLEN